MMRKFARPPLHERLAKFLIKSQEDLDRKLTKTGENKRNVVKKKWDKSTTTKSMKRIRRVLASSTGKTERCVYCQDSQATTLDHYRPKSEFHDLVFLWSNLLIACQPCNLAKGDALPVAANDSILFVDVYEEDPWSYIEYSNATDLYTARWIETEGGDLIEDPKGDETLKTMNSRLGCQAVIEGRRKARIRIEGAIRRYMDCDDPDLSTNIDSLKEEVADDDSYGLFDWFFRWEGKNFEPFRSFRLHHPSAWQAVVEHIEVQRANCIIPMSDQWKIEV